MKPDKAGAVRTAASVARALVVAVLVFVVLAVVLGTRWHFLLGPIVAAALAGGGFIAWSLRRHPALGEFLLEEAVGFELPSNEEIEAEQSTRRGREYLDRVRDQNRFDST